MIKKQIYLLLLFILPAMAGAQVGIDLTQMVPAPDSAYIILTTGDEYPVRGVQKYIAFDSLIPLETVYQKPDSICFRFAHSSTDQCFAFTDSVGGNPQSLDVIRDGDTIRISIVPGNQIAFKDSTRSDQDIADIVDNNLVNIYNSDGTLNGSRLVNLDGNPLIFQDTDGTGHVYISVIDNFSNYSESFFGNDVIFQKIKDGDDVYNFELADYNGSKIGWEDDNTGKSNYVLFDRNGLILYPNQNLSALDSTSNYFLQLMNHEGNVKYRPVTMETVGITEQDTSYWNQHFSGDYSDLTNQPTYTYIDSTNQLIRCQGTGSVDTTCAVKFDGVDDYAQSANTSDLNFTLPIKVTFSLNTTTGGFRILGKWSVGPGGYFIGQRDSDNTFGLINRQGSSGAGADIHTFAYSFSPGEIYTYEVFIDGSDLVQTINGIEEYRTGTYALPTVPSSLYFELGNAPNFNMDGKIYSFQVGSEAFGFLECEGSTITGSEGTSLSINGAMWNESLMVNTACDTFQLSDTFTDSVWHSLDSIHIQSNNGKVWTVIDNNTLYNDQELRDSLQAHLMRIIQNESDISEILDTLLIHRIGIDDNSDRIQENIDTLLVHRVQIDAILDSILTHRTDIYTNNTLITDHINTDQDLDLENELQDPYMVGDTFRLTQSNSYVVISQTDKFIDSVWRNMDTVFFQRNDTLLFGVIDSVNRAWLTPTGQLPNNDSTYAIRHGRTGIDLGDSTHIALDMSGYYGHNHFTPGLGHRIYRDGPEGQPEIIFYGNWKSIGQFGAKYNGIDTITFMGSGGALGEFAEIQIVNRDYTRMLRYGQGIITGTPTFNLSVDEDGKLIETNNPVTSVNNVPPDGSGNVNVEFEVLRDTVCAISFDGTSEALSAANTSDGNIEFPLSATFSPSTISSFNVLIGKRASGLLSSVGANGWSLHFVSSGDEMRFLWADESNNEEEHSFSQELFVDSTYTVEIDTSGGDLLMYMNGTLKSSASMTYNISSSNSYPFLVSEATNGSYDFMGTISEIVLGGETFAMNEGSGTSTTGSLGTVLDFEGTPSWECDYPESIFNTTPITYHLENDKDTSKTNELQIPIRDGDSLYLSDRPDNKVFVGGGGGSGAIQDLSSSKAGNEVTVNISDGGNGTTFNIEDGDSDPNNETPVMQPFPGSNMVRFVPGYYDLVINAVNGIVATAEYSSGVTDVFEWEIDGSALQDGINDNAIDIDNNTSLINGHISSDNDLSNINERQELSIKFDTVCISFMGDPCWDYIKLPPGTGGDSLQSLTLEIIADTAYLGITGRNIVKFPIGGGGGNDTINFLSSRLDSLVTIASNHPGDSTVININDGDPDPDNENQDISFNKSGNTVTASITNGTGDSFDIRDGDSDDENEIQYFSGWTNPSSYSALHRLSGLGYGGLRFNTNSGVTVTAGSNGTDNTVDFDFSGLSISSPWSGSSPRPYISTELAAVGIRESYDPDIALLIDNSQASEQSLIVKHRIGDGVLMSRFENTLRGGSVDIRGQVYGVGLTVRNTSGATVTDIRGNGIIYTTGPIYTDGNEGTSNQVLYGGSNPSWGNLPSFSGPWTSVSGGIHYQNGVSIGTTSVANGFFRVSQTMEMFSGNKIEFQNSGESGYIYANPGSLEIESEAGHDINIEAAENLKLLGDHTSFQVSSVSSGGMIITTSSDISLTTSGVSNGTVKIVLNTSNSVIDMLNSTNGAIGILAKMGHVFVYNNGWYPCGF